MEVKRLADRESKLPDSGRLAENIVYFARALRKAGIPVGPGSVAGGTGPICVQHYAASTIYSGLLAGMTNPYPDQA